MFLSVLTLHHDDVILDRRLHADDNVHLRSVCCVVKLFAVVSHTSATTIVLVEPTSTAIYLLHFPLSFTLFLICSPSTTALMQSPTISPVVAVMQGWVVGFSDVGMHAQFTAEHGGQNVVIASLARILFLHFEEFFHLPEYNTEITQSERRSRGSSWLIGYHWRIQGSARDARLSLGFRILSFSFLPKN